MTYRSIEALKPKNMKNSIRFTPETKINASQVAKIKIDCPISGCEINNKIIGDKIKKLYKYFKWKPTFSLNDGLFRTINWYKDFLKKYNYKIFIDKL